MGFVSLRRSKENVDIKLVEKDVQLCSVEFPNNAHKMVYDALLGTLKVAMEAILSQGDEIRALKHCSSILKKYCVYDRLAVLELLSRNNVGILP
jgi:hypothetical protein